MDSSNRYFRVKGRYAVVKSIMPNNFLALFEYEGWTYVAGYDLPSATLEMIRQNFHTTSTEIITAHSFVTAMFRKAREENALSTR